MVQGLAQVSIWILCVLDMRLKLGFLAWVLVLVILVGLFWELEFLGELRDLSQQIIGMLVSALDIGAQVRLKPIEFCFQRLVLLEVTLVEDVYLCVLVLQPVYFIISLF
jgi:hypothetical protein